MTFKAFNTLVLNAAIGAAACLGAAVIMPTAAEAATQRINCPPGDARREITTDIPSGWWTKEIVNRLTEVRVQNIGSKLALICKYGAAGTLQRYAPAGVTCRAKKQHFICQAYSAKTAAAGVATGRAERRQN